MTLSSLRISLFLFLFLYGMQSTSASTLSFALTYEDVLSSTGAGFDHPTLGFSRRAELTAAANDLGTNFNHPGSVVSLYVLASEADGTGLPAVGLDCHAVGNFATNGGFYEPYALIEAETGNGPLCAAGGHMNLQVDFGHTFDFDATNGTVGWDFETAVKQGMVHAMGYGSDGIVAGGSTPYGRSSYNAARPTSHDRMSEYLFFDDQGISRVWGTVGTYNGSPTNALSDGDVHFHDGPFGNTFPLSLGGGESFDYSGVAGDLMSPLTQGVARAGLTTNDSAALSAIGWDVSIQGIIPEPTSGCMAMYGLLLLLELSRRRHRAVRGS